jgi:hypothetical protein
VPRSPVPLSQLQSSSLPGPHGSVLRCVAHTIQLVMKHALENSVALNSIIDGLRKCVKKIKNSAPLKNAFAKSARDLFPDDTPPLTAGPPTGMPFSLILSDGG